MRWRLLAGAAALSVAALAVATYTSVRPISLTLPAAAAVQVLDRHGTPLTATYHESWNVSAQVDLHQVPAFMQQAFLQSEDKKFYQHGGVDWRARGSALWQNIRYGETVRGASTITEQVVRMVHPRRRHIWSKYIEGFEAASLERQYSKADILEFYLNQIPYASHRRGIAQAAHYYFGRDLSTLTEREMLALTVLARAPSAYDLYRHPDKTEKAINRLAEKVSSGDQYQRILNQKIKPQLPQALIDARHFSRYVRTLPEMNSHDRVITTLDAGVQAMVQGILDQRVKSLSGRKVRNGAALVIDHTTGEVLAWVVAGAGQDDVDGHDIDAVTVPRQPGSSLKPFLYARALDKGWNAATFLDDSPLSEAVGTGLHRFRNYSRGYYGPVSVREALGNSLNIPALLTIRHVGVADYMTILQQLGFYSLDRAADVYDEGLALGNGEVTLLELAQAYAVLAHNGAKRPLRFTMNSAMPVYEIPIYTDETASVIGNILSDPWARRLEFGSGGSLNLPVQTAVKTGTSTDYRDAWVAGYNDRYVVAIWMGNLDRTAMDGVTGSIGPAMTLRGIFAKLNEGRDTKRLHLSPHLVRRDVCIRPGADCAKRSEWLRADDVVADQAAAKRPLEMVRPTDGLQLAYDPRVPADHQKFRFEIDGLDDGDAIAWFLNGALLGQSSAPTFLWPVQRGKHKLQARIIKTDGSTFNMAAVGFIVK